MNRIEFYNRVDRFKEKLAKEEELKHASGGRSFDTHSGGKKFSDTKYYTKIDNYYSDGRTRYFYSKDEWDAYLETKNKGKEIAKKNDSGREAAMKNSYSAEQQRKEEQAKKEEEERKQREEAFNLEKQRQENYRKNMEAAQNAEKDRYTGVTKKVEAPKTREQAEKEAQQRELERQNSQPASAESKRIMELEDEIMKLTGKINLAKNREKTKPDVKNRNDIAKYEKEIANKQKSIENLQKQISKKNDSGREAAMKKSYEAEQERRNNAVKEWKKEAADDAKSKVTEIQDAVKKIYNDLERNTEFKIDNEISDLFKEELAIEDPDFDGDITKYIRPDWYGKYLDAIGGGNAKQEDRVAKVNNALEKVAKRLYDEIDAADYDGIQYGTYLDGIKAKQNENKTKAITKDLAEAKLRLSQIYQGNSNGFKMDESLMKVLNEKLQDIDATYDGDIESYVRPYLFGKWIKDDVSYNNVKKALDEIEKELKAADKNNDSYGTYIQKVSKILS